MKVKTINILLVIAALIAIAGAYMANKIKKPNHLLPYLGEEVNGKHHGVPDFEFTDQEGARVTRENFKGGIYVTEFFFATCQSICPVMNKNMKEIFDVYVHEPRLKFLSHTVRPEEDSVPALRSYAATLGVTNNTRWHFVTGDKKELYRIARKGYLVNNEEGDGGDDDFIHTQYFVLVDWNYNLRGVYDGTSTKDIERLKVEIKLLLEELSYTTGN